MAYNFDPQLWAQLVQSGQLDPQLMQSIDPGMNIAPMQQQLAQSPQAPMGPPPAPNIGQQLDAWRAKKAQQGYTPTSINVHQEPISYGQPPMPEMEDFSQQFRDPQEVEEEDDVLQGFQQASTKRTGISRAKHNTAMDELEGIIGRRIEHERVSAENIGQASDAIQGIVANFREEQIKRDEARRLGMKQAEEGLQEARLLRQYGQMDIAEIRYHQQMITEGTPEQQVASRRALQKAEEIDPGRFWSNRTPFQKVMAVIAIVAGANLQRKIGGPNVGMQMINQAIDQDIKAQEDKFRKRGFAVRDAQSYVELVARKFDREDQRALAAKTLMLEEAQLEVTKMATMAKSEQTRMALKQEAMQLKVAAEQHAMQLEQNQAQFNERMELERMKIGAKNAAAAGAIPREFNYAKLVDPSMVDTDSVKKAKALDADFTQAKAKIERLIELREEYGYETLNRQVVGEMRELRTDLIDIIRRVRNYGARFEDTEEQLINSMLSEDPSGAGFHLGRFKRFRDRLIQDYAATMGNYGYKATLSNTKDY